MQYTTTLTSQGQVTIPALIRKALGLQPRDKVSFEETEKQQIIIKPAKDIFSLQGSIRKKVNYSDQKADQAVLSHIKNEYQKKQKYSR